MVKFLKWTLLIFAIVLLGAIVSAIIGLHYLRGVPKFYKTYKWTGQQQSVVAQKVFDKLTQTREMAIRAHAAELQRRNGHPEVRIPTDPVTVTFTEEEINAAIHHSSEIFKAFTEKYREYLKDPGVFFDNGCIILAGEAGGYIVGFYFRPQIDDRGDLRLDLVKATGGNLSLPKSLLDTQLEKLRTAILAKMPEWRKEAKIDDVGTVNRATVAAAMSNLLLCALSDQPAPAVLFMPKDEPAKKLIPVRISKVKIDDESLTLTMAPMDKQQRETMFRQIQGEAAAPR